MIDGDKEALDSACRTYKKAYPHHYRKRITRMATMILGEYGDDPDTWLETMDDTNRIALARDALPILAKAIRAERMGKPKLALAHYKNYVGCRAVVHESDGVNWRFARWRVEALEKNGT